MSGSKRIALQTQALANHSDPARGYWLLLNILGQLTSLRKRLETQTDIDIYQIRIELKGIRIQVNQMVEWSDMIIGYSDDEPIKDD